MCVCESECTNALDTMTSMKWNEVNTDNDRVTNEMDGSDAVALCSWVKWGKTERVRVTKSKEDITYMTSHEYVSTMACN